MTPSDVVHAALYGSARSMVPKSGLAAGDSYILEWSPSNVAATVPGAVETALTPKAIATSLAPATIAQTATQDLALAAVIAVML